MKSMQYHRLRRRGPIALAVTAALAGSSTLAHAAPEFGAARGEPLAIYQGGVTPVDLDSEDMALDADGDGLVVWAMTDYDTGVSGVYARRMPADGSLGPVVTVAESDADDIGFEDVSVAVDADGDAVVVWIRDDRATDTEDVWFRRLKSDGTAAGASVKVTATDASIDGEASDPAVAMDAAGNIVIGWEYYVRPPDGYGGYSYVDAVQYRRFDAAGNPLGTIQTPATMDSWGVVVAMNARGDIAVGWNTVGELMASTFAADGTPVSSGPFVLANPAFSDSVLALDADGDLVAAIAAYEKYDDGAGGYDAVPTIVVSRFRATGERIGDDITVAKDADNELWPMGIAVDADGDITLAWAAYAYDYDPDTYISSEDVAFNVAHIDAAGNSESLEAFSAQCTSESDEPCSYPVAVAFDADGDAAVLRLDRVWHGDDTPELFALGFQGPESADLAATLTVSPTEASAGDTLEVSLTIENLHALGNTGSAVVDAAQGATNGVAVEFTVPASFDLGADAGEWTCEEVSATTIRCTYPGTLQAASEVVFETQFQVPADAADGEYTFSVSVSGERVDPEPGNNVSSATVTLGEEDDGNGDGDGGGGGGGGGAFGWLALLLPVLFRQRRRA